MRPLFVQGTVPPPTNFDHRLQQAEARVLRLPLRRLLVDHRTWTNDQVLLITDPDIDRFRLMKIMADVATRLDGGNVSERAWMLPPSNYLRGHTPDHTGEVFDSETKYMSNSEYFWAQVIRLDKYCPREVYGITSKRRLLLFSAETQTMFHGILAGTWGYRDACLIHGEYASPETCANRIIDAVQGLWNQDWNTTIWPPLYQFLDLTVKTWIGQIRLINGAKGGIIRITLPTDDTASNSSESDGDEYTDIWL